MARIVVETDDGRAVLDERGVGLTDIRGESAIQLLDRLESAIEDAERPRAVAARSPGGVDWPAFSAGRGRVLRGTRRRRMTAPREAPGAPRRDGAPMRVPGPGADR
jgi:hypothetical protein